MAEHRADSEPPCAGPDAVQQDHDALADDWSHTADRKAKKRMQNRVAQRSYSVFLPLFILPAWPGMPFH